MTQEYSELEIKNFLDPFVVLIEFFIELNQSVFRKSVNLILGYLRKIIGFFYYSNVFYLIISRFGKQ